MISTQIRPLTSAEYYQMMETGIIQEGERVELISGQIFTMAAKGIRHTICTRRLFKQLLALIGDRADVQSQDPITLPNNSEPEPDVIIAKLREDNYENSHPVPADIILIIEVSDTTLKFDREVKVPLYATAGINEYWIVNLIDNRLEIYRQPIDGVYTNVQTLIPPRSRSVGKAESPLAQETSAEPRRSRSVAFGNSKLSINPPDFPEITLDISDFFPAQKA
jgi:Uma2 family endonuclease